MHQTHTPPIVYKVHPCNQHLVPAMRFDDYPDGGTAADGDIVFIYIKHVNQGRLGITAARNELWTYHNREIKLSAFDRWLMSRLEMCQDRPCQYLP